MASQYAQEQQQQPQQQQPAVVATPAVAPVVTAASHGFPTFASLWVGDLDPNITETQLCELFQEYGQISTIKLCKDNVTHQSLCYAYVNFYNAEDAERARLALNHKMLGKREMRIMKSQRDPSVRRQNVGNLFVKNLPKAVRSANLETAFSEVGQIMSCKVVLQPNTGDSMQYGFVHFTTPEAAQKAIEQFNMKPFPDPALQDKDGKDKLVQVMPFIPRTSRSTDMKEQRFTNVYVKHIEKTVTSEQLNEKFGVFGEITSGIVLFDKYGKSLCHGFVNFKEHESAVRAVNEMNGKLVENFSTKAGLYVQRAQDKFERQAKLKRLHEIDTNAGPARVPPLNLYVKHIGNLDDAGLRALFADYGEILSAKVMTDDNGQSKGFGFVCFKSQTDAMKALNDRSGYFVQNKPIYISQFQKKDDRQEHLRATRSRPYKDYPIPNFTIYPQQLAPAPMMPQSYVPRPWPRTQPSRAPAYLQVANIAPNQQRPRQTAAAKSARAMQQNIKFSSNTKNAQVMQMPMKPEGLVADDPKQIAGERLWHIVSGIIPPEQCGKITGMVLESLGVSQVLALLEDKVQLKQKILEAQAVYLEHQQRQRAAGGPIGN